MDHSGVRKLMGPIKAVVMMKKTLNRMTQYIFLPKMKIIINCCFQALMIKLLKV